MLRAFWFASGVFVALWGAAFLMVDQMTFAWKVELVVQRDPEHKKPPIPPIPGEHAPEPAPGNNSDTPVVPNN